MIDAEVRKTIRGGRQMTGEELDAFLKTVRYGTLSYMDSESWHKTRGEKLKDLTSGKKVCISFYTTSDKVGLEHICQHDSVLVYGRLERLDGPDEDYDEIDQGRQRFQGHPGVYRRQGCEVCQSFGLTPC